MGPSKTFWLLLLLCTLHLQALCQKAFVEGTLVYSVSLSAPNGQESLGSQAGNYTLTVKGKQSRKELHMNSGFQNIMIMTGKDNEAFSLQRTPGQDYAIQVDPLTLQAGFKKHRGYTIREENASRVIAGYTCKRARVTFPDGSTGEMYFTRELKVLNEFLFDRFPGIEMMPLYFEYRNESGVLLQFTAERVLSQPVEAGQFRIPQGYKLISAEEYKSLGN